MSQQPDRADISTSASLIVEFLRDRDEPCPMCGYNLRGQTSAICPECGCEAQLELRPVTPRMAAWITGLVGLSAGFGFSGLLLGYFVWMLIVRPYFSASDGLLPLVVGTMVNGICAIAWIRYGRFLRRSSAMVRWVLASSTWLLAITTAIAIFTLIK